MPMRLDMISNHNLSFARAEDFVIINYHQHTISRPTLFHDQPCGLSMSQSSGLSYIGMYMSITPIDNQFTGYCSNFPGQSWASARSSAAHPWPLRSWC